MLNKFMLCKVMFNFRFAAVGKLSGGHQAAIMVIGVDQSDDKDIVITGSKDHYIKVNCTKILY